MVLEKDKVPLFLKKSLKKIKYQSTNYSKESIFYKMWSNYEVNSYNAGYHRGLNTEYHDVSIPVMFETWLHDNYRTVELSDLSEKDVKENLYQSFVKGYKEGLQDYSSPEDMQYSYTTQTSKDKCTHQNTIEDRRPGFPTRYGCTDCNKWI